MAEEIDIGGVSYVSSKRAAQISDYTRDYIGQLCREGNIRAEQVDGLWYVDIDSLYAYKKKADSYVPVAPRRKSTQRTGSLVSFDGKDYITATRAAEITGYHQDYIGQLARAGKVLSRQIGSRWYVERSGILAHKRKKDALLAAVQAEAVGIRRGTLASEAGYPESLGIYGHNGSDSYLTYTTEESELFPALATERSHAAPTESGDIGSTDDGPYTHRVPIRVLKVRALESPVIALSGRPLPPRPNLTRRGARWPWTATLVGTTLIILLTAGYVWIQGTPPYRQVSNALLSAAASQSTVRALGSTDALLSYLEGLLAPELVYRRSSTDFEL